MSRVWLYVIGFWTVCAVGSWFARYRLREMAWAVRDALLAITIEPQRFVADVMREEPEWMRSEESQRAHRQAERERRLGNLVKLSDRVGDRRIH